MLLGLLTLPTIRNPETKKVNILVKNQNNTEERACNQTPLGLLWGARLGVLVPLLRQLPGGEGILNPCFERGT